MEIVNTNYELLPNLENIAKLMIPRIGEKPIELKASFAPDIPQIMYGDLGKIKTKAKTSAITELERQLESKNKHKSGKTVTRTTETSVFEQFLRG